MNEKEVRNILDNYYIDIQQAETIPAMDKATDYALAAINACRLASVVSEEQLEDFIFKWWLAYEGLNGNWTNPEDGASAEFIADIEKHSYDLAHAITEYVNGKNE